MADTKLSALTELSATPADADELYIRDVSEAATDESKRITVANLKAAQTVPTEASQAEMEAETETAKFAPPDLVRHSPGVAKGWVSWEQSGVHSRLVSYNWTSTTDSGAAGRTDHLFADDMSGTTYVLAMMGGQDNVIIRQGGAKAAGGITTTTEDVIDATDTDTADNNMVLYGTQA